MFNATCSFYNRNERLIYVADDMNHSMNRKCARSSAWVPCFELKPGMGLNVPFNGCKLHFMSLFEYYIIIIFSNLHFNPYTAK